MPDGTELEKYGLTRDGSRPAGAGIDTAVEVTFDHLRAARCSVMAAGLDWAALQEHGVGVPIVHLAREAVFAVRVDGNVLRHHVRASRRSPDAGTSPWV